MEFLEHAYRREDRVILDEADLILRMDSENKSCQLQIIHTDCFSQNLSGGTHG